MTIAIIVGKLYMRWKRRRLWLPPVGQYIAEGRRKTGENEEEEEEEKWQGIVG